MKRGKVSSKEGTRNFVEEKNGLGEKADRESNILSGVSPIVSACAALPTSNYSGVFPYKRNYRPGPSGYIVRLYAKNYGARRI